MGPTDDVINVAGHRLSTGAMEAVVAAHPDVAECAVIGVATSSRVSCPVASWCSRPALEAAPEELQAEARRGRAREIGPVAALPEVAVVPALPKTRSGKILRKTMRGIADGATSPFRRRSRTSACFERSPAAAAGDR